MPYLLKINFIQDLSAKLRFTVDCLAVLISINLGVCTLETNACLESTIPQGQT